MGLLLQAATAIFRSPRLSHGVRPGAQRCSLPLRWYLTRSVLGTRYRQLTFVMRRGGWRMSLTTLPGLLLEVEVGRGSIARGGCGGYGGIFFQWVSVMVVGEMVVSS